MLNLIQSPVRWREQWQLLGTNAMLDALAPLAGEVACCRRAFLLAHESRFEEARTEIGSLRSALALATLAAISANEAQSIATESGKKAILEGICNLPEYVPYEEITQLMIESQSVLDFIRGQAFAELGNQPKALELYRTAIRSARTIGMDPQYIEQKLGILENHLPNRIIQLKGQVAATSYSDRHREDLTLELLEAMTLMLDVGGDFYHYAKMLPLSALRDEYLRALNYIHGPKGRNEVLTVSPPRSSLLGLSEKMRLLESALFQEWTFQQAAARELASHVRQMPPMFDHRSPAGETELLMDERAALILGRPPRLPSSLQRSMSHDVQIIALMLELEVASLQDLPPPADWVKRLSCWGQAQKQGRRCVLYQVASRIFPHATLLAGRESAIHWRQVADERIFIMTRSLFGVGTKRARTPAEEQRVRKFISKLEQQPMLSVAYSFKAGVPEMRLE